MSGIEHYIDALPPARQARFCYLFDLIRDNASDAHVSMKYKMPTFESTQGWLSLGNQKGYISVYTCKAEYIESYLRANPKVKHGKACLNFRDGDAVDEHGIVQLVRDALHLK